MKALSLAFPRASLKKKLVGGEGSGIKILGCQGRRPSSKIKIVMAGEREREKEMSKLPPVVLGWLVVKFEMLSTDTVTHPSTTILYVVYHRIYFFSSNKNLPYFRYSPLGFATKGGQIQM